MTRAIAILTLFLTTLSAAAVVRPSMRHEAGGTKTGNYLTDGFFSGGERTVTLVKLKDVRRAKNANEGFERVVFDLEPQTEDPDSVPYFQVQANPGENRIVLSIWANVQYDFDPAHVRKAFAKSANIKRLNIIPRLEDGLTIIELVLDPAKTKKPAKFEAFRLAHPARIIMDII
jgi:hypothetical protein